MKPFHFKQFAIQHGRAGLKVGIDSVLFGAVVNRFEFGGAAGTKLNNLNEHIHVADVGTGSGLLALMLRQGLSDSGRSGRVVAIDIDSDACEDARVNVAASPWDSSMEVVQCSWQNFEAETKLNFIVSNPPFFPRPPESSLAASTANKFKQLGQDKPRRPRPEDVWSTSRAHARFSDFLPLWELFSGCAERLVKRGGMWLLHSYECEEEAIARASEHNLRLRRRIRVAFKVGSGPKRSILHFQLVGESERRQPIEEHTVAVRNEEDRWTEQFVDLTSQYYAKDMSKWAG